MEDGCLFGEIAEFLRNARDLRYDEKPNYELLKKILLSGLEHKGMYDVPLDFITAKNTFQEHPANRKKADLPKQVKKVKKSGLKNMKLTYCRKATVARKSSQIQDELMLARLNKPLQTEVERKAAERTYFHTTFQKAEEKSMENGFTYSPISQPGYCQTFLRSSSRSFIQELYQYIVAIIVLLLLIVLSLYFL